MTLHVHTARISYAGGHGDEPGEATQPEEFKSAPLAQLYCATRSLPEKRGASGRDCEAAEGQTRLNHGETMAAGGPPGPRFWVGVDRDGPVPAHAPDLGPCWLWTRSKTRDGYGRIRIGGRERLTHRLSLETSVGPPPSTGHHACHRCDVPACVRPSHLFWGTAADNQRDAYAKGRNSLLQRSQRGEANNNAKLDGGQVASIRERLASGDSRGDVAEDFGVSYDTVRLIELGRLWPANEDRVHELLDEAAGCRS